MKFVSFFLLVFLVISSFSLCADEGKQICILYFNDLHGHLQPYKKNPKDQAMRGGIAKFKKQVDQVRQDNQKQNITTFLFYAGDLLQGTVMSTVFQGEPDIQILNMMNVDAGCPGNHELDFGFETMLKICREDNLFPIVCTNLYEETTISGTGNYLYHRPLPSFVVLEKEKIRLAVIGAITPDAKWTTHPKNVQNLIFTNPVLEVAGIAEHMNDKVDMVVVVSHCGKELDRDIAKQPGVDLVIGGHDHVLLDPPEKIGLVPVCQAGDYGDYLGRIDFRLEKGQPVFLQNRFYPITEELPEDEIVAGIVARYAGKLSSKLGQVIGKTLVPLDGERAHIRWDETNLGNLIADSMRVITKAEIALINSGGIRASIQEGPITIDQVYQVLPFSNTLVTGYYQGSQILEMLNRSVSFPQGSENGAFLQVSGITFEIVDCKPQNILIGNESLQLTKKYKVAITDFMAAGGDGYTGCKEGEKMENTGYPFNSLMIQYLQDIHEVSPQVEGRIRRK
ncbi:MAG: 5'-nucleotidase C-terminal domain-containing protein [Planctomycetota bacterium]